MSTIRFGAFELDPDGAELRKSGVPLKLPPQPFQVLVLLASKPGQLVTREQIQQEVWGHNSHHLDQGINSSISQIRTVLGDVADEARYIETVPRRGYRFIAPVAEKVAPAQEKSEAKRSLYQHRPVLRVLFSTLGLIVATLAVYLVWQASRTPGSQERDTIMLVALPFRNLGDGDNYFSDGLTEEIITHLGRMSPQRLRVIAPTSAMAYRNAGKTVEQIASELGVDYILEGGVRRFEDRVRISVQLTEARDQTQLWSMSYERRLADVLDVQSELARRIARSLALELMPEQHAILARASTTNPAAYLSYLQGRYHLNRLTEEDLRASLPYFEEAIDKDPDYALAYVGLADSYIMLGVHNWVPREVASQEARRASLRALSIDDMLGEAYASLGLAKYWFEWDWLGAEREFQQALELTPNYSTAHKWYGALLGDIGRLDEALEHGRQAQELDPRAPDTHLLVAEHLYHARRFDEAMDQARALVEMDPTSVKGHRMLERIYTQKALYKEAIQSCEDASKLSGGDQFYEAGLAYIHAVSGRRADAERMLANLMATTRNTPAYEIALVYTALGEPASALNWLDRAWESHRLALTGLQVEPMLDELRSQPRFQKLVDKMRYPPVPTSYEHVP